MGNRRELKEQLAREEETLSALSKEMDKQRQIIASLKAELNLSETRRSETSTGEGLTESSLGLSAIEKVHLFRSLFRGREDVFARRWENAKTGRSGYALACENEWIPDVCAKIGLKGRRKKSGSVCAECKSQRFQAVTDTQITRHLKGLQVIGVYPLLMDETCWFLAVDFDGETWQEDTEAFSKACAANGFSASIERSRSGNGAHAWFFFFEPIPAVTARTMGCFLLTETMTRRHQLPMRSYDRLFPNQDTMPKGGFGNLIALPLQREARLQGNSVFLDDRFLPSSDQWAYLASVQRIKKSYVQAVAREASRSGQTIGLTLSVEPSHEDSNSAFTPCIPTRLLVRTSGPLPRRLTVKLGNWIRIAKENLPSSLLNSIKRLAVFQNPEFYQKQRMRLSTAMTPRVIACFEEDSGFIKLPRGCFADLATILSDSQISMAIQDDREIGTPLDLTFHGRLTEEQESALQSLLSHETGVLVAPPGVGKTVTGVALIAARGRNTLVLVHRKPLLDQWISQIALFLGIAPKEIGQIGGGRRKPNGLLDVATIQSLVHKGTVDELVGNYGHVLVDECHHVSAFSFERVLAEARAKYVTGLTATARRRDGHEPIIRMQLGPIRHTTPQKSTVAARAMRRTLIVRETGFDPTTIPEGAAIQEIYALLSREQARNDLIFDDVIAALEAGRSSIVLTERRDHLEHLAEQLQPFAKHTIVFHGGLKARERRESLLRCREIPAYEERLLLATGRFLGEGFDDARLDTLFLTLPVSWRGTLVQYTGRLHRCLSGRKDAIVYDYLDERVPLLKRMFEKRLRGYRAIGYELAPCQP